MEVIILGAYDSRTLHEHSIKAKLFLTITKIFSLISNRPTIIEEESGAFHKEISFVTYDSEAQTHSSGIIQNLFFSGNNKMPFFRFKRDLNLCVN